METERLWRPPKGSLPPDADFAVTTRRGGVSEGPFATLNVGLVDGEREERIVENRRRVRSDFGATDAEPLRLHQVHGTRILAADAADATAADRADGFLIRRSARAAGTCVAVSVADCAPVAIVAGDGSSAALLHGGWRGSLGGIASRAVALLAEEGAAAATLRAVIGPCVHACCYPVGPEVAARFPVIHVRPHPGGRLALDLPGFIAASLAAAGVPESRVAVAPECTSCRADLFFSYRRDRGVTGRHWALLRLGRPPGAPG